MWTIRVKRVKLVREEILDAVKIFLQRRKEKKINFKVNKKKKKYGVKEDHRSVATTTKAKERKDKRKTVGIE